MKASEARKITDENAIKEHEIENRMLTAIQQLIYKDAKSGSDFISVYTNQITENILEKLKEDGFDVEFKKAYSLMDKDVYYIKW